jgi:hypothetical protein
MLEYLVRARAWQPFREAAQGGLVGTAVTHAKRLTRPAVAWAATYHRSVAARSIQPGRI